MSNPIDLWSYHKNFDFDRPLSPDDEMLVDLREARGNFSRDKLLRQLGVDSVSKEFKGDSKRTQYVLFGGHRGCGKSTELRAIANDLQGAKGYFVVFIDAVKELDVHNLRYSDIALAQAEALINKLKNLAVEVDDIYLENLNSWFDQRVERIERSNDIKLELQAGAKATGGLPWLAELFTSFTSSIRNNTSYKDEIRREVRDSFSQFASAFNQLLEYSNRIIVERGVGRCVIFIVDGTDRLNREDSRSFFLQDIHQLQQIKANFVYCAPIQVMLESGQLVHNFDGMFKLPMVKLAEKQSNQRIEVAWHALRTLVTKRLPVQAFSEPDVLDKLINASGGHPRDLLRLVSLCFQETDAAPLTSEIADADSRLLAIEDYKFLYDTDMAEKSHTVSSDQSRQLLYDLCLLEYNDYWWQSHPAVRQLPGYQKLLP